jgi:hypothetical protein
MYPYKIWLLDFVMVVLQVIIHNLNVILKGKTPQVHSNQVF